MGGHKYKKHRAKRWADQIQLRPKGPKMGGPTGPIACAAYARMHAAARAASRARAWLE